MKMCDGEFSSFGCLSIIIYLANITKILTNVNVMWILLCILILY